MGRYEINMRWKNERCHVPDQILNLENLHIAYIITKKSVEVVGRVVNHLTTQVIIIQNSFISAVGNDEGDLQSF